MKWNKLKDKKPPLDKKLVLYENGTYVIAEKDVSEGWFKVIFKEIEIRVNDIPDHMLWLELPEPPTQA